MALKIIVFIFCLGIVQIPFSQIKWSSQDKIIFNHYIQQIQQQKPVDNLAYTIHYFLNTPYVLHTLEKNQEEELLINMHEVDCMTYVENVLALVASVGEKNIQPAFEKKLQQLRYRNGQIKGYLSRLHYFSDWIQNNERKGIVNNITSQLLCIPFQINLSFMSSNSSSILLKKYPQYIDSMKIIEQQLNQQSYCYIPKDKVGKYLYKIETGDILALTTNLKGLDIAHVGFAYWEKDTLYIVHASSSQRKVVKNVFLNYLLSIKHFTGLVLVRSVNN